MSTRRRTAAEMYPLLELYYWRTQTAASFCAEHGITPAQLIHWRRKHGSEETAASGGGFVEVASPAGDSCAAVEIAYPDGVQVRFFALPSASYMARLVGS